MLLPSPCMALLTEIPILWEAKVSMRLSVQQIRRFALFHGSLPKLLNDMDRGEALLGMLPWLDKRLRESLIEQVLRAFKTAQSEQPICLKLLTSVVHPREFLNDPEYQTFVAGVAVVPDGLGSKCQLHKVVSHLHALSLRFGP